MSFARSSVGKLRDSDSFAKALKGFGFVPNPFVGFAAVAVIVSETLIVILLTIGGPFSNFGFGISIALLTVFSLVICSALVRHEHLSCNCFGTDPEAVKWIDLARNGALLLLSVLGWALAVQHRGDTISVLNPQSLAMLAAGGVFSYLITSIRAIAGYR